MLDSDRIIPEEGYVVVSNILSNYVAVQFAVPDHEWSELEQSKEWRAFQALLEKAQEQYIQRVRKRGGRIEKPDII